MSAHPKLEPNGRDRADVGSGARIHLQWHARSDWFWRLRGLLGRPAPLPGHAWLLRPCRAVHTLGMGYRIDIVFADDQGRVLRVCESVAPARFAICWRAACVAELRAGECRRSGIVPGVRLALPDMP